MSAVEHFLGLDYLRAQKKESRLAVEEALQSGGDELDVQFIETVRSAQVCLTLPLIVIWRLTGFDELVKNYNKLLPQEQPPKD